MVKGEARLLVLEEGEGNLPEVAPLLLVRPPLGQLRPVVEGVNEGEEVRRVVQDRLSAERKAVGQPLQHVPLNGLDVGRLHPVHVVPEALARELRLLGRPQPTQDAVLVPTVVQRPLALRVHRPVQSRNHQVLAHREWGTTTGRRRRNVPVHDLRQPQLLGPLPQQRGGPELFGPEPLQGRRARAPVPGVGRLHLLHEPLFRAQVDLLDDPGLPVRPGRADPVGVLVALLLVDDRGHGRVIHDTITHVCHEDRGDQAWVIRPRGKPGRKPPNSGMGKTLHEPAVAGPMTGAANSR